MGHLINMNGAVARREGMSTKQTLLEHGLRLLWVATLMMGFGCPGLHAEEGQPARVGGVNAPPYNIVFVIVDQQAYRLLAGADYALPGIDAIARHGVTFQNHYIASAMCTASRAAFLTGQPPQVNGVFDQMQYVLRAGPEPRSP